MIKKLKDSVKKHLYICLFFSVTMVLAIPIIVLSAINAKFILMGIAIAFFFFGFFGLPFLWLGYISKKLSLIVYEMITVNNTLNIRDISKSFNRPHHEIKNIVVKLINKGYLNAYTLTSDDILIYNKNEDIKAGEKCPNCGANLKIKNNTIYCEYCLYEKQSNC